MWNLDFGFKEISAKRQNWSGGAERVIWVKAYCIHEIMQSENHSLVQLIYEESKDVLNWWRD